MLFNEAFDELIHSEGGYTDDTQDSGNWTSGIIGKGDLKGTKYGISAASYPHLDIKSLTLSDAKLIYKRDYWDVWDSLPGMSNAFPDSLLYELFDAAVNTGMQNAKRFLQRAVNVADDGLIGPVTIAALDNALTKHGIARVEMWFLAEKQEHYTNLKKWDRFGKGWAKRIVRSLRNV